jgi:hypothetical protein
MKRDEPKAADEPSDLSEQLKELLTLRRKVRAAEMTASSRNGGRPDEPINRGLERSPKMPSESSRKLRR